MGRRRQAASSGIGWANTITHLLELCEEEGGEHWHPELGLQNVPEADALIVKAFEWGFGVTPSLPLPKRVEQDVIDADATDVTDEPAARLKWSTA